jgi:hypothetical protein
MKTVALKLALGDLARKHPGNVDGASVQTSGDAMPKVTQTVDRDSHSAASA